MRKVGVEVVGVGALKLTTFLRDLMQQKNIHFESIYTVRSLKEVLTSSFFLYALVLVQLPPFNGKFLARYLVDMCVNLTSASG